MATRDGRDAEAAHQDAGAGAARWPLWTQLGGFNDRRGEPVTHMWTQDESGRVHTPLEPVVLAATLALIPS